MYLEYDRNYTNFELVLLHEYWELANKLGMCDYLRFTLDLNIDTTKIKRLAAELHGWQQSLYARLIFVPKLVILVRLRPLSKH